MALEPRPFAIEGSGPALHGDEVGEGTTIVLLHGLTATRRYVVHGSKVLPREGFRAISYDARAHGESDPGEGYGYESLAADLGRVIDEQVGEGRVILAGHSMGAHTVAAFALANTDRVAAAILIGPVFLGVPYEDTVLRRWDSMADGLERVGVEGFLEAYSRRDFDPEWRATLMRITRERLSLHSHPAALAQALREVPRSLPFDGLEELEFLDLPALVVASHDEADPGHPFAIAEAWAERLPEARLVSEGEGASPLAWQGGKLSREIVAFCREGTVIERLEAG